MRRLRTSSHRYDELVKQIPAGIYALRMSPNGNVRFEYVSEKLCQMLDCDEKRVLQDPEYVFDTIHPDDRESMDVANRVAAQTLGRFNWEGRCRLWGKMGWVHIEAEPCQLPDGDIVWNGVVSDVSGRKEAELALHESQDRFGQLFASMEEGFFLAELIYDSAGTPVDWRFLDVNPAYSKIMGLSRAEVLGRSVRELFSGLEDFWFDAHTHCALTGEPATLEGFVQSTGRHYINHLHSPRRGQFACLFRDITARKETERALQESEWRFRDLVANVGLVSATLDIRANITFANKHLLQLTGWSLEEVMGRNWFDVFIPADAPVRQVLFQGISDGTLPLQYENEILTRWGERRLISWNNTLLRDSHGIIEGIAGIGVDITERKEAEETANRLAAIVTSSDDAIIGMDLNKVITSWNHGAEKIFGYSADEMVGTSISQLIPTDRQEEEKEILARISDGGSIEHFETIRRRKDGGQLNVSMTFSPIRNDKGMVVGVSRVARDITARKQAEACRKIGSEILHGLLQSEDLQSCIRRIVSCLKKGTGIDAVSIRLEDGDDFPYSAQEGFSESFLLAERSLLSRTSDGRVCRDENGKICLDCTCGLVISGKTDPANPQFTQGGSCWTNDSLHQPTLLAAKDPRHHPRNRCIHEGYASVALIPIRTQERITGLIQMNDRRKNRFTLETVEILEGIAGYLGEALMRKKSELERNEALLRAETSAAAKNDFLSVMSHELRTPLNGVLGFTELLTGTPLNDEQKSFAETIRKSGEHLLSVVNDILDFSCIEKGTFPIVMDQLEVPALLMESLHAVQTAAADKGLDLRCEMKDGVPGWFLGDEQRIRQILINLLGNAVKFTPRGSIVLSAEAIKVEGEDYLDFSIKDTGIGIPAEMIEPLFEPFIQMDATKTRQYGGTGLGLAISQRLAEAMGGKIRALSAVGQGSTFSLRLPLKTSSPQRPSPQAPVDSGPISPAEELALVVDDDKASVELTLRILQICGYRAEAAANGYEALEAFIPGKYAVILMDLAMPVMNGFSATQEIRRLEAATNFHVPIIALTANVMPGDREKCLAANMDDFLAKPFKRDELAAKLASAKNLATPF